MLSYTKSHYVGGKIFDFNIPLCVLAVLFTIGLSSLSAQTASAPTTGDGSSGAPYEITSLENLYWIASSNAVVPSPTQAQRWAAHYKQTAFIDASTTSAWSDGGWSPIGNSTLKFTGSYDGNGYTIDGLYINRSGTDNQGLFGYTNSPASIQKLGVTGVQIAGSNCTGGIAGYAIKSNISYCFSTGTVTGYARVGGLIGYSFNSSNVNNCYSRASAGGNQYVGGLSGSNMFSNIQNCYSSGVVSGNYYTGGLLGYNQDGTVSNCYWDTETSGQTTSNGGTGKTTEEMKTQSTFTDAGWDFTTIWNIGGGMNDGYPYLQWQNTIIITVSTASITDITPSSASSGGEITIDPEGINITARGVCWSTSVNPTILNSHTTDGTGAGAFASSITGLSSGTTYYVRAYATSAEGGTVYGDQVSFVSYKLPVITTQEVINVFGNTATGQGNITVLGIPNPTEHGVCWNTTGSPTTDDSKTEDGAVSATGAFTSSITGLSPAATYYVRTYVVNDAGTSYGEEVSFTTKHFNGSGTELDPYQISTFNDLHNLSANSSYWNKNFIQISDIDASSTSTWDDGDGGDAEGWSPIGNSSNNFTGKYNGQSHYINGLFINRSANDQGLFGVTQGAEIKNLGVTNVQITGLNSVGGLVGNINMSTVLGCYSTGNLNGVSVGGIVGYSNYSTISNCYSTCSVNGGTAGGLVQFSNYSTISNCYSTGSISGSSRGGFIEFAYGGSINNCFWDTQTSGISTSAAGTGNTTAEMKTSTTFEDASWDFTGSIGGVDYFWQRDDNENGGYPYLWWQTFPNSITITDGSSFNSVPNLGEINQPVGRFALNTNLPAGQAGSLGAAFNAVWINLNGTRTGVSNFKLWESNDDVFNSDEDMQLGSTAATDPGDGQNIWFTGLSKLLAVTHKYYFLTCDLASDAGGQIQAVLAGNKDLMFGFGTLGTTITNVSLSSAAIPLEIPPTTFFVDVSATTGSNNGLSWANAFSSLQAALDAADSGDQIWVAKGTYKPSQDYDLGDESNARLYHFRMMNGVSIYGGFAGNEASDYELNMRDFETNETILSGDIGTIEDNSDNCYHVFYHPDGLSLNATAILDGFTISGGNANGSDPHSNGGGMNNSGASPKLINVTISNNSSSFNGGGINNNVSSPGLTNVIISNNSSSEYGGGMSNSYWSSPGLINVTICNNSSGSGGGGGIYNFYYSSPGLTNVTICNNSVTNSDGGGMRNDYSSSPTLKNVIIFNNSASSGGGMYNDSSSPILTNVTISNNSAVYNGGGINNFFSSPTLNNSIVWGNTVGKVGYEKGNQIYIYEGTTTLNYSCYANETNDVVIDGDGVFTTTNNNITTDPKFVESASDDFRIAGDSPCKDAGSNDYNATGTDIRGQVRIQNTTIDMGAYEFTTGIDPEIPLPVEIISFTASVSGGKVTLNWQTATEVNNYGFEIERSIISIPDGRERNLIWEKIGFVQGSGNSNSPKDYSFVDDSIGTCLSGQSAADSTFIQYRLKQIDTDGSFAYYSQTAEISLSITDVKKMHLPAEYVLEQNYPNPFNPSTIIRYGLSEESRVMVRIYDFLGQEISTLFDGIKKAGYYEESFNASRLASGIYILNVYAESILGNKNFTQVKKMLLIK